MKIRSLILAILLLTFPFILFSQSKQDPNAGIDKYIAAMQLIKFAYVDTVKESKLVETALIETLKELDPHSQYISKKELAQANEPLVGNFEGIGVQFQIFKDTILIVHPIPGGPSYKLGIQSGDKIIRINEEEVAGKKISNKFVFDRLRGKKGTKVNVSILRRGNKDLLEYAITRDKIPINSIDAAFMFDKEVGYINLNRFSQTTMNEFRTAMDKLKAQGIKKLILDLRGNSGGYLNTAVELSDEFLPSGKLVVYTKGMRAPSEKFVSSARGNFEQGQLVILINEGSASASEIVSGSVQDWDRGIILGRRSFGKGLVQRPFMLPDSSELRLTTARYYTPSGRCIQRPYTEGFDDYMSDFRNRVRHGELVSADSIHMNDSLKYFTNNKRTVYGGGGIMPDVFVAWDSTIYTDYYTDLRRKDVINGFVTQFVDNQRADLLKKYPEFLRFKKDFVVDEEMLKDFIALGEKEGVPFKEEDYHISKQLIANQLKALTAQKLWDYNAFFEIALEIDNEFLRAIDLLKGPDYTSYLISK
ncbi:MAG: PDZ domain-containing protein [Bacteroidetes bacterium]|nr:PDZ domain-containing protein [Bacteroidota bacterium]